MQLDDTLSHLAIVSLVSGEYVKGTQVTLDVRCYRLSLNSRAMLFRVVSELTHQSQTVHLLRHNRHPDWLIVVLDGELLQRIVIPKPRHAAHAINGNAREYPQRTRGRGT